MNSASATIRNGSSSQVSRMLPPASEQEDDTAIRFSATFISAVSTAESGTARRGKSTLRISASRSTSELSAPPVASREEREQHDAQQQRDRVELDVGAEPHDLREDHVEDAEEHQRADQLPQVAERGAEEAQLEVADGHRPRQVPEPARVGAERGRALDRRAEQARVVDAHDGTSLARARRAMTRPRRAGRRSRRCAAWPETSSESMRSRRSIHAMPPPWRATAGVAW